MTRPYVVTNSDAVGPDEYLISRFCTNLCGVQSFAVVKAQDLWDYEHSVGEKRFVQTAFPYLSDNDREMLLSGVCPACWEKFFGDEPTP